MAESVGDIVLDASIDGSALPAQLRRAASAAAKGVKIEVPADLDEKGLAAEVEATAKALSRFAEIEFKADLNSKQMAAEVAALKRSLGKVNIANAPTELRSAWAKAAAAARKATEASDIRIKASVDFDEAERKLAQLRANRLFAEKPIKIPVEIDDRGQLLIQIQKLKRQAEAAGRIEIEASIDLDKINKSLQDLSAQPLRDRLSATAVIDKRAWEKTKAQLEADLAKNRAIKVSADLDLAPLREKLASLNKERRAEIDVQVDLDAAAAKIEFEAAKREIEGDATVKISLEARPDILSARIASDAMRAAVNESPIRIPIEVDGSATNFGSARLSAFNRSAIATSNTLKSLGRTIKSMKFVTAITTVTRYFAASLSLIAVAAGIALPYVEALGALIGSTAIQLLAAASAAGTFVVAGIAAIGGAAATAAIGVMGMGDAFDALSKIWAKNNKGLKATKEETKAYKDALKGLHPEAQKVVTAIDAMHPAFRQLQQQVQGTLFKGLGDQLRLTFSDVLPSLRGGFTGIAEVLNTLAVRTLTWIRSSEGVKTLNQVFEIARATLTKLGDAAGNVALGLLTLFVGSDDNIFSLGNSLVGLTEKFRTWADEVTTNGTWAKWLEDGKQVLSDLGRSITGVKNIAVGFWQAISGDEGADFTDLIDGIADKLQEWGDWMRDPANQEAIKNWATDAAGSLTDLAGALKTILELLEKIAAVIKWLEEHQIFTGGVPEGMKLPEQPELPAHGDNIFKQWWEKYKKWSFKPGEAGGTITLNPVFGPLPPLPPPNPPIQVPVTPKLGPMPPAQQLNPIPWPILPKLGPIPALPLLSPIFVPIISRWLAPPPAPYVQPLRTPIISKWSPIPVPPILPILKSVIKLLYGPVPPDPYLPPLKRKIELEQSGAPWDPTMAAKGATFVNGAQLAVFGEAGPEAIVPLTRTQPLDPSVSALLRMVASSRGMDQPTAKGKDLPANINVMLPTGDPEAAAMAVWNRLVFEGVM